MKLLLKLVFVAVVLLGLLGLAGWLLVPPAAKNAVERGSSYAFGVPTTLANLDTSLGFGTSSLTLEGYAVQSPAGFDGKPLLAIQKLAFGVGTRSLAGEPKVLDELVLEGLELNLVQKGTANNLWPVLQQVRRLASGDAAPEPEEGGEHGSPGPRIRVRRVRIAGLAASIDVSGIPGIDGISKRFELPAYDADWSQLTGEEGLTVAQLSGKLMEEVTTSALSEADEHLPAAAMLVVRATLEGGAQGGVDGALDAAREAAEDAVKKELQGLEKRAQDEVKQLLEKGSGELERGKEMVQEKALELVGPDGAAAVESALDGAVGGILGDTPAAGATEQVAGSTEQATEKAAGELEKATEKATDKAGKAVESVLPDAKKKLFGGLKGSGGGL
jgi:hypothetical protein